MSPFTKSSLKTKCLKSIKQVHSQTGFNHLVSTY